MIDRPSSPVVGLDAWWSEEVERSAEAVLAVRDLTPGPESERLSLDLASAWDAATAALAQLKGIEAEWRGETRGPWFRWGLAEIQATEREIKAYRAICERAGGRLRGAAKEQVFRARRERATSGRQGREAIRARREPQYRQAKNFVVSAAAQLVEAVPEQWGPQTPLGLQLRSALAELERARMDWDQEKEA